MTTCSGKFLASGWSSGAAPGVHEPGRAAQGNQRGGASGGGGLGFVGGQGLGMGFPEGRGVLLIGRRGGSRRACPRDGRAKSPAEMRLRCERRGEGVGADMRARRDGGGARGVG